MLFKAFYDTNYPKIKFKQGYTTITSVKVSLFCKKKGRNWVCVLQVRIYIVSELHVEGCSEKRLHKDSCQTLISFAYHRIL